MGDGALARIGVAATTIGLAGCGTAGMITDGFGSVLGSEEPKTSTLGRAHDAECKESGYKPGTKGFIECRLSQERERPSQPPAVVDDLGV